MSCLRTAPTIAEPIIIGADRLLEFQIDDDEGGGAFNLAGAALLFEIHRLTTSLTVDGAALVSKSLGADLVITDAAAGEVRAWITSADGAALAVGYGYGALLRLRITGTDGRVTWPVRHRIGVCPF